MQGMSVTSDRAGLSSFSHASISASIPAV